MKKIIFGLLFLGISHATYCMNDDSPLSVFYQMIEEYKANQTHDQLTGICELFDNLPQDDQEIARIYLEDAHIEIPRPVSSLTHNQAADDSGIAPSFTVEQSDAFKTFARAIEAFNEQPTAQRITEIVSLVQLIQKEEERSDAESFIQGILAQYDENNPIFKAADTALKAIHKQQVEVVYNHMHELQSLIRAQQARNRHLQANSSSIESRSHQAIHDTEQLTTEIARLTAEAQQVQAERDALDFEVRAMQSAASAATHVGDLEAELKALIDEIKRLS